MIWLHAYEAELKLVFDEAEKRLSVLPESLRQPALEFLDKFHVLKEKSSKNYICYLLPFWLEKPAGISTADSRRMAVANIFGMMYYHLLDAAMDKPDSAMTGRLPMAQLVHLEFIQIYSRYFPGDSPFWNYHRKYVTEWAESVSREAISDYFHDDPVRMAHKAAPVKLSIAGALLLTERGELIPRIEQAVDTVLMTLQLLDDWDDWEKDLRENSYNALVSVIQTELSIPRERRPTVEEMRQGITVHGGLSRLAEQGNRNHDSLTDIQDVVPDLFTFHADLRANLNDGAVEIEQERNALLRAGGLRYWLDKNMS
ncbi:MULTISPECIES: hypothetical protein [Paenibacillus]|uniref:hypothetical protein n=1 Tax=Paenibacillus TaxID=44249 RepID=UPI002FE32E08